MAHFPTSRLVLFSKARVDGMRPIYLRVTYRRKNKYFSLNRQCFEADWDSEACRLKKTFSGYKRENDMLRTYEQRAADAIRDMERDGVPFTFERFEQVVFQDRGGGASMHLVVWLRKLRDEFEQEGRYGNSRFYHQAANTVEAYKPRTSLADMDEGWLRNFERWTARERNMNSGGLSICMRTIRASCNRAIQDKIMPRAWYPFESYSLAHLKRGKAKKAAPLEFFRELAGLDRRLLQGAKVFALDLFLFSFYTRGMNLADIAELTTENIEGGRLTYTRKKTGKAYSMRLNEKAAAILKKYETTTGKSVPVFPVYPSGTLTDKQKHYRRVKVSRQVNEALREIAEMIGWEVPGLSFYTARHSYADILKKAGVSVEVISEALGHADIRTTDAYLKGFGDSVLDEADNLILN